MRGAVGFDAGYVDGAVMGGDDGLHDRQAEAEAAGLAGAGFVGTVEAVEDVG